MHDGWNDGFGSGNGWWMAIMMIVVIAAVAWIIATVLTRETNNRAHTHAPTPSAHESRLTPQEILAERLARGEIDPDDYATRLGALLTTKRQ